MTLLELTDLSIAGVYSMTITGSIIGKSVSETFNLEIKNPCSDPLLSQILFSGDAL